MAIYSGFSHKKWWFSIVFSMFTRGYQDDPRWSKMHWPVPECPSLRCRCLSRKKASSVKPCQPCSQPCTWSQNATKLMPFGPSFVAKISNFKASRWIGEGNRKLQVTPSLEDGFSPVGLNLRFWCAVNVLDSWTRRKAAVSFAHPYGNDI